MLPKKHKKRVRTDTFWKKSPAVIVETFQSIMDGKHALYSLDKKAASKTTAHGTTRSCWALVSKANNERRTTMMSTKPYRLAMVWAIETKFYQEEKLALMKERLPDILGKTGDHTRHLCGYEWCCNPKHLSIGTREENENDKHYHYFLNHTDERVRKRFRETFGDLIEEQGVW
jgi:hypothetical protein